jgi:hypothetical protein
MKIFLITLSAALILIASSCTETVSPASESILRIHSEIKQDIVQIINSNIKIPTTQKTLVDSIKVTSIKMLIKTIKFHQTSEANDNTDVTFKVGPFLFSGDSAGSNYVVTEDNIKVGLYNKIKFELHRFSTSDLAQYSNDIKFHEFATTGRYTVIMKGYAYKSGTAYEFVYNGNPTANLSLDLNPELEINKNTSEDLYLQINPLNVLKIGDSVLDPRDPDNSNDIDFLIQSAIKAIKK